MSAASPLSAAPGFSKLLYAFQRFKLSQFMPAPLECLAGLEAPPSALFKAPP